MSLYKEYKSLQLPGLAEEMLKFWKEDNTFSKSISTRPEGNPFVFYEGPPSANGLPGIHHVMARTIKDIFCRYKTLQGFRVERKAGWDTHGLPVELGVEKALGITKEDIGKKITVEEYNDACKKAVMKYTDVWNNLTQQMGYWVNMDDPYVTYENKYIESVWWLLNRLYEKGLLYKGYTIQPYSPKAGTGLSTHELNQPGCYKDVKDTTIVAQFKAKTPTFFEVEGDVFFIAWTTTPWTLPANTALAVGKKIEYSLVKTFNQYTGTSSHVLVASNLINKIFSGGFEAAEDASAFENFEFKKGKIPFQVVKTYVGSDLVGQQYEQLIPLVQPMETPEKAFRIIEGDFVSTEDGTGIVHLAPTFGADDYRVAKEAGVPALLVKNEEGEGVPIVDQQGKYIAQMGDWAGMYVKQEYYDDNTAPDKSLDVLIAIHLKEANLAFKVEKYEHSYPHCWRTDKPVLYYPLDSWFVKTTDYKEKLIALNKTINWKPKSTGEGRFGNWLENLNDWNLSRSRYWGIPIPIWRTEDKKEEICISSAAQLKEACEASIKAGLMNNNPLADFDPSNMSKENYETFDLHKNYVDDIVLVSPSGKPMHRESDLIDVWFDSGSMPYAQWHYPFENKDKVEGAMAYPADFIAEGVDQTRGWFFTLHAISTLCFDQVAYKNVVSNGLVLDKNGQKMSKRLGNAVDPFETLKKYGPDATRWYMLTNAQPWDNLKFDELGIEETQRKFFRALHNTYSFFTLYANVDGFAFKEAEIKVSDRPEIDRWIISKLNSLVKDVAEAMDDYEPTKATRAIQEFVVDHLSNWYVRLCRKRFWRGEYEQDKISAYQTLYTCLETISVLASPFAPFFSDRLYQDLTEATKGERSSVHLADYPKVQPELIDSHLEKRMSLAQQVSSMILSIRKKENLKVRLPLAKAMIPVRDAEMQQMLEQVSSLIKEEVNIKALDLVDSSSSVFVKTTKANFKTLGPRYGKMMKPLSKKIMELTKDEISKLENGESLQFELQGNNIEINLDDVEIRTEDIDGWQVATSVGVSVALDINPGQELKNEGLARELVNRIQNIRKDKGFEVTDKINIQIQEKVELLQAVADNKNYICAETLATNLDFVDKISSPDLDGVEIEEGLVTQIAIQKN